MAFDPNKICPHISGPIRLRKCLQHDCQHFVQIQGANPQTGEQLNEFGCAIAWMPVLQIETAQQARQAGAAVESFRNRAIKIEEQTASNTRTIASIIGALYNSLSGYAKKQGVTLPAIEEIVDEAESKRLPNGEG